MAEHDASPDDQHPGLLPGEPGLEFIPMAVRRALDRAGLRISLQVWQAQTPSKRVALLEEGARDAIDVAAVTGLLEGIETTSTPATPDPAQPPAGLRTRFDTATWQALSPVARHALFSYSSRGKPDKVEALLAQLRAAQPTA